MTSWQTDVAIRPGGGLPQIADPGGPRGGHNYTPPSGPRILGLGKAVLRRSKLLFMTVLLLNVVAFMGVRSLTPRYTASADLLVGPRETQVVDLKAVLSGLSGASDVIESEIQVVRSREIARGVVRKLNLDQMPEFNPGLREPGLSQTIQDTLGEVWNWSLGEVANLGLPVVSDYARTLSTSPAPVPRAGITGMFEPIDPLSAPVDRFLSLLDVASKGRSRVITISFTSMDAALAAKVPNAVADAYIANQLNAKTDATSQAHKWLDERVAEMREQLLAADEAVEAYRRRAGIVQIRDSTLLNQQISEAGQELMRVRGQLAAANGRLAATANVSPNATGLKRDIVAAQSREQALEANMASLRKLIDIGSQSEIGLRALQREADADRNLYDRLLARARETKVQGGLQQADATVISRAERTVEPSFPKKAVILPLFFIASCMIGVLLVLWLENLDSGFLSPEQLEAVLGIPALGAIPLIKRGLRRRNNVETYCLDHPKSSFAESIRNLHASLMLAGRDGAPKTVLIASSLPSEGKSSVSVAMASMMASWGKRVAIVDCDLRNPTIHKSFHVGREPGLTEVLSGRTTLEAALRQDPVSSAWFLSAGEEAMLAPDLFASGTMQNMLSDLSAKFDLVILDGGPVLGVSDTRHLCRLADRTVFVIRWQDTRCSAATLGLRQLADAGANVAGALLTMMEPKQYQKYSLVGIYRRRLALYIG